MAVRWPGEGRGESWLGAHSPLVTERLGEKIPRQHQFPDVPMEPLYGGFARSLGSQRAEGPSPVPVFSSLGSDWQGPRSGRLAPSRSYRPEGCHRHLGLQTGRMISSWSSHLLLLSSNENIPQKIARFIPEILSNDWGPLQSKGLQGIDQK